MKSWADIGTCVSEICCNRTVDRGSEAILAVVSQAFRPFESVRDPFGGPVRMRASPKCGFRVFCCVGKTKII